MESDKFLYSILIGIYALEGVGAAIYIITFYLRKGRPMAKGPRVDSQLLLEAGLRMMAAAGKPLKRKTTGSRAMIYEMPNGESVRLRTSNDHVLIILADRDEEGASLNIEGTDWLLLVMPEEERTPGRVMTYLLPTEVPVQEARRTHKEWRNDEKTNTGGDNRTWNLWLRADGPAKASGYGERWAQYRLSGEASTDDTSGPVPAGNIRREVDLARTRLAEVAGVRVEDVRITIDFGSL